EVKQPGQFTRRGRIILRAATCGPAALATAAGVAPILDALESRTAAALPRASRSSLSQPRHELVPSLRSVFLRARKNHQLGPRLSGGGAEQVLDMLFNRARRQMQPGRDLLVRD